jgi:hypothetical protein
MNSLTDSAYRARPALLVGTGIVVGILAAFAWSVLGSVSLAQTPGPGGNNCQTFQQTGHKVCGRFLQYWQQNGGLAQQGYPISETFTETSDLNGRPYTVQYFERAVFELHPDNQPPYDVLLSQLGTFAAGGSYPQGFSMTAGETPFYEQRMGTGTQLLKSFYNAINRKEYERAYSYYQGVPNPDPGLAAPYAQWVQGYADTLSVVLAAGKETVDAGAGNIFASVPVVITATRKDGSQQVFSGCYTLHRVNFGISEDPLDTLWSIRSATIAPAPANANPDQLLARNCTP